jgi:hypothetical protein
MPDDARRARQTLVREFLPRGSELARRAQEQLRQAGDAGRSR